MIRNTPLAQRVVKTPQHALNHTTFPAKKPLIPGLCRKKWRARIRAYTIFATLHAYLPAGLQALDFWSTAKHSFKHYNIRGPTQHCARCWVLLYWWSYRISASCWGTIGLPIQYDSTSVPIQYVLDQYNLGIHADSQAFVHLFFGKMLGMRAWQYSKAFYLTIAVRALTLSTYSGTLYLPLSLTLVSICLSIFLSRSLARSLSRSLYYTLLM